jgi:hypothetical protein
LYTSCVLWVAPLCAFFNIFYLSKKIIYSDKYEKTMPSYGVNHHLK